MQRIFPKCFDFTLSYPVLHRIWLHVCFASYAAIPGSLVNYAGWPVYFTKADRFFELC
jgi:hypothetical protein